MCVSMCAYTVNVWVPNSVKKLPWREKRDYHVNEQEKLGQKQVSKVTLHFWGHYSRKQTMRCT